MNRKLFGTSAAMIFLASALCVPSFAETPQRGRSASASSAVADEEGTKEVFTGTLIGVGGRAAGQATTFTLTLDSRVSRAAAQRYANLLRTKGQNALLKQLEGRNLGTFATVGSVGRAVQFAYEQKTPEGRRITVLFERWLEPFEVRYGTRSQTYPFSYMELSIDNEGKGNGTLIGAAKVYFEKDDPNTLNVENFGVYPLRVVNVEVSK